jgi:hypothetical protein
MSRRVDRRNAPNMLSSALVQGSHGKVCASVLVRWGAWASVSARLSCHRVSILNLCGGCLCLSMWWLPLFKLGKGVGVVKQRYLRVVD